MALTEQQRKTIREVIEVVSMKGTRLSAPGKDWPSDTYTAEVREATELWRESYIIGPLQEMLEQDGK